MLVDEKYVGDTEIVALRTWIGKGVAPVLCFIYAVGCPHLVLVYYRFVHSEKE
jgi:amino acid permease